MSSSRLSWLRTPLLDHSHLDRRCRKFPTDPFEGSKVPTVNRNWCACFFASFFSCRLSTFLRVVSRLLQGGECGRRFRPSVICRSNCGASVSVVLRSFGFARVALRKRNDCITRILFFFLFFFSFFFSFSCPSEDCPKKGPVGVRGLFKGGRID